MVIHPSTNLYFCCFTSNSLHSTIFPLSYWYLVTNLVIFFYSPFIWSPHTESWPHTKPGTLLKAFGRWVGGLFYSKFSVLLLSALVLDLRSGPSWRKKKFKEQNFFSTIIFFCVTNILFTPKKYFWPKIFFRPKFFSEQNFFSDQNFCWTKKVFGLKLG